MFVFQGSFLCNFSVPVASQFFKDLQSIEFNCVRTVFDYPLTETFQVCFSWYVYVVCLFTNKSFKYVIVSMCPVKYAIPTSWQSCHCMSCSAHILQHIRGFILIEISKEFYLVFTLKSLMYCEQSV